MPEKTSRFDADLVRAQWDFAADAYASFQDAGDDYYRYELFGPAHVELCGDVRGLRLLDLGCGTGYFSREMSRRGAIVTGIDISAGQLGHARRHERDEPLGISYAELDAASLTSAFALGQFGMVTACLSLQDMPNPQRVIAAACEVLQPGGRLVFSISHPATDTPLREWQTSSDGRRYGLTIGDYFDRTAVSYDWRGTPSRYAFRTTAIHATLADWFGWVLGAGLQVRGVLEPRPSVAALQRHPDLEDAAIVPHFLLVDAVRPA
jgi:ubiquinone/menaquinone biosynthesis C-methylase UbiE